MNLYYERNSEWIVRHKDRLGKVLDFLDRSSARVEFGAAELYLEQQRMEELIEDGQTNYLKDFDDIALQIRAVNTSYNVYPLSELEVVRRIDLQVGYRRFLNRKN